MNFSTAARRREKGQAAVEFALTVVFLMLLIVGFIELIMMLHTYNVIADAAKEGVRYAIVHGAANTGGSGPTCPCSAIDGAAGTGVVKSYAQYSLHDTSSMTVTVNYNPGGNNGATACNKSPCLVRVTVRYPYQPFFGLGWPTVNVNAAAQGRIVF
jgi:Flp pilus assembly protein TadG